MELMPLMTLMGMSAERKVEWERLLISKLAT